MKIYSSLSCSPVFRKKNFKFHSNLKVSHSAFCKVPKFYEEIFIEWGKHLFSPVALSSTVACQFIWYNRNIQIGNKSIYLYIFSKRNLNFVGQLFDINGKLKSWECIKRQFLLTKEHAVSIPVNFTCSTLPEISIIFIYKIII